MAALAEEAIEDSEAVDKEEGGDLKEDTAEG